MHRAVLKAVKWRSAQIQIQSTKSAKHPTQANLTTSSSKAGTWCSTLERRLTRRRQWGSLRCKTWALSMRLEVPSYPKFLHRICSTLQPLKLKLPKLPPNSSNNNITNKSSLFRTIICHSPMCSRNQSLPLQVASPTPFRNRSRLQTNICRTTSSVDLLAVKRADLRTRLRQVRVRLLLHLTT